MTWFTLLALLLVGLAIFGAIKKMVKMAVSLVILVIIAYTFFWSSSETESPIYHVEYGEVGR